MTEKELYNQLEEYDKTVIRLSKELSTLNKLNQQNLEKKQLLQQRIDKSIKLTEELYKMAKEQDSDNVNLIDRLEIILKTLKGE